MLRPLSGTVPGTVLNVVIQFDVLHLGNNEVTRGMDSRDEYAYVLVILDNVSSYVWLRSARACTANYVAEELVMWCSVFGSRQRE